MLTNTRLTILKKYPYFVKMIAAIDGEYKNMKQFKNSKEFMSVDLYVNNKNLSGSDIKWLDNFFKKNANKFFSSESYGLPFEGDEEWYDTMLEKNPILRKFNNIVMELN